MSKKTIEKTISPKGTLQWVTITGEGIEGLSEGKYHYKADIVLDPKNVPEHKAYIDNIDKFWKENKPSGFKKKPKSLGYYLCDKLLDKGGNPIKDDEDSFVYDPDGRVAVTFKTTVKWPDGKQKIVRTRNAKGVIVNLGDTSIGNGSRGYIAGSMDIYTSEVKNQLIAAGVTLYLDEIKITKLVEFQQNAFADHETDEDDEDDFTGEDLDSFASSDQESPEKVRL